MPTYQYACTACEHRFEIVQSFTDDALTDCPECAGRLRKLFSSVGVVFKGSGFYRTDSRGGNGEGSTSTVKAESKNGDSTSSGSTSSDTKTASTSSSDSGSSSAPKSSATKSTATSGAAAS